jgi:hypothetical protein
MSDQLPSQSLLSKILPSFAVIASLGFTVAAQLPASAATLTPVNNEVDTQVAQTDRWTNQVRSQLLSLALAAGFDGNSLTHEPFIGDLGNGGEADITLNVRSGVSYAIVGVCDNDCRDMDLKLYDDNGNLISSDTQRDDTPLVRVTPRWNARFTIRVIMANCSNAPCRYGIGFFGK